MLDERLSFGCGVNQGGELEFTIDCGKCQSRLVAARGTARNMNGFWIGGVPFAGVQGLNDNLRHVCGGPIEYTGPRD